MGYDPFIQLVDILIAGIGTPHSLLFCWILVDRDNGSSWPQDLFGPEPTFTEVEKQWEPMQLPTQPRRRVDHHGRLLAIIVALVAVQTFGT